MRSRVRMLSVLGLGFALAAAMFVELPSAVKASEFWDEVRTPGLRTYRLRIESARRALVHRRFDEALELTDQAVALIEDRALAHVVRSRALAELDRSREAVESIERALAIDEDALSNWEDGAHAAQVAASAASYELARRILKRALGRMRASPTRRGLYVLYGDVLSSLGPTRVRDAVVAYRESIRHGHRGDPRALLGLALALDRTGETLEASDLAREGASPGRVDLILTGLPIPESEKAARRAMAFEAIGDVAGAREAWREVAAEGGAWSEHARQKLDIAKDATTSSRPSRTAPSRTRRGAEEGSP